ncbi:GroES-like protein [Hymenopellis radicata]|nr:GroES-like protein [Hymenopellis radicata]
MLFNLRNTGYPTNGQLSKRGGNSGSQSDSRFVLTYECIVFFLSGDELPTPRRQALTRWLFKQWIRRSLPTLQQQHVFAQNIQALVTKQSATDRTVEVRTIPFGDTLKIKSLAPHEIVVKIKAIGLNPTDWKLTIGPWSETVGSGKVVGHDAAGDVIRVGANVEHLKIGDRVACQQFGCYYSDTGSFAEYSRFDSALVFKLPHNVSYEEGAALPAAHYTAMQALYGRLKFPFPSAGTVDGYIIIWGAATACGHQVVQLARLAGLQGTAITFHAVVIILTTTASKSSQLRPAGTTLPSSPWERPPARITRTPTSLRS